MSSPTTSTATLIRKAGFADIPAIARITQEGPQPAGIEPEVMSRAARLFLTHVAFEHGALWVEQTPDGPITRAVTAIPAAELPPRASVLHDMAHQLSGLALPSTAPGWFGAGVLVELRAVAPTWVLSEISRTTPARWGDPALLAAALDWSRAEPESAHAPVLVLADSAHERAAAQDLGFVERPARDRTSGWWIGVAHVEQCEAAEPGMGSRTCARDR